MSASALRLAPRFGRVAQVGYAEAEPEVLAASEPASDRVTPTFRAMDEAALADLYRRCSPAIYAHCRRLLGSPAAARDATQEAFVRVMAKGPRLVSHEDALRYLYRVATNVCLNQIRERKVHDRATPALMARAGEHRSGESGHADRQFASALLDRCDETGSSIAVMHYVDGMSQVEIADVLGITRRTVFNRLRKIEKLARELLGLRTEDTDPSEAAVKDETAEIRNDDNDEPEGLRSTKAGGATGGGG